jgi:hypothetical protein
MMLAGAADANQSIKTARSRTVAEPQDRQAFDITVPLPLSSRADEVIE